MTEASETKEFRITISGLDLSDEHAERINRAVQQAVMIELANLNFTGDIGLRFPRPPFLGLILLPPRELE